MGLDRLADDELRRVLALLDTASLSSVAQVNGRCNVLADSSWARHASMICTSYNLDRRDFEENFMYDLKQSPLLPKYDGPPLRMPYLTPNHWCTWRWKPTVRMTDEGLQYSCYPTAQEKLAVRDEVWITCKFPVMCCGFHHGTRSELEAHCLDMRHYERMQSESGQGRLNHACIDPRLTFGQEDFEALPKREQYMRMRRYVDAILSRIERRSDPANWDEYDMTNLRLLSEHGLSFMNHIVRDAGPERIAEFDYLGDIVGHCREACQPENIGAYICQQVLEGFEGSGVYTEVPEVPYYSVRDFITGGLADCDPDGGSSSGQTWWSGLSELFELHYEGRLGWSLPIVN